MKLLLSTLSTDEIYIVFQCHWKNTLGRDNTENTFSTNEPFADVLVIETGAIQAVDSFNLILVSDKIG
jgi:hypothetical protein